MSREFLKIIKSQFQLTNKDSYFFFEEFISFNSVRNILFFFQFENFFVKHKIKSDIYFSFENQPWEKALLYFFYKRKNIKKSYGVIHSSVRFWDFRFVNFINDKRKIKGYFNPDKILCNSSFSKKILENNGFKKTQLMEVESIRYANLKKIEKKKSRKIHKKLNILFLTDYDDHVNNYFIKFIGALKFKKNYSLFLKYHPLKPLSLHQKNLKIIDNMKNINKNIDLVIVGNKTTASIDAYYKNLDFFIFLEPDDLDYSPLYKFINYSTFTCIKDLEQMLDNYYLKFKNRVRINNKKKIYFTVDKNLPRWNKLIKI